MQATDPLRDKLKALVEEWRWNARNERIGWPEAAGLLYAADRLEDAILNSPEIPDGCAALLAESEPEPRYFQPAPKAWGLSGHLRIHPDRPDCEAKAKLPRHLYGGCGLGDCGCTVDGDCPCYIRGCGQPRSAHEPKQ